MTTTPFMLTVCMSWRIALTAAPSAPFLSPRPTQRPPAIAAASVTRTSSSARFRSGASTGVARPSGTVLDSDVSVISLGSLVGWLCRDRSGGAVTGGLVTSGRMAG